MKQSMKKAALVLMLALAVLLVPQWSNTALAVTTPSDITTGSDLPPAPPLPTPPAKGEVVISGAKTVRGGEKLTFSVTIDGKTVRGRVTVENGATYVPLRLVGEALGCQVEWDPYLRGATVTSPGAAYDAGELYWLSRIICAESGAESMSGQIAVGNVILNRVRNGSFPNTVEGVIFDRKDAVQFEPVSNGRIYLPPTSQSVEAAKRALDGENVVGSALYFYAPALSQGTWINANRPYQQTIGCHRFYR